jgi:carbon monoxide dehydrogenase subunit G
VLFEGVVTIKAPIEKVWASLTDPNFVSQCAPGLESMQVVVPDKQFNVVAAVGFGAIKVRFNVDVEWVELRSPDYAKVKAHGKGQDSSVDVVSEMRLSSEPDGTTTLKWNADTAIIGSIASLAARLMGGITKKMSGAFFDCVKEKIEA